MARLEKSMTPFGMIMLDYMIFNVRRGWLRGAVHEAIPLRHVTSVTLEIKRYPALGILFALLAIIFGAIMHPIGTAIAMAPLAFAVLLLWGLPSVKVDTADGNLRRANGLPWARPEAEWFVATAEGRRRATHY